MKQLLSSILAMMFITSTVMATDLWFTWTDNPTNEMVTSYVIEQLKSPATNFVPVVTVSGTTNVARIRGLTTGSYKFRIVAKNGAGSAPPSNELSYPTNVPSSVLDFQFTTPR